MIELNPISFDDLKPLISIAFMGDRALRDFHISPSNTRDMVNHTYNAILAECNNLNLSPYCVSLNSKEIGFTVLNTDPFPLLYSFGLNFAYRTVAIKEAWLNAISQHFDDIWLVGLNNCNQRAINFFLRQGFKIHYEDNIHHTKLLLCQHSD